MPELPEVETVKRGLSDLCCQQTVKAVHIRFPTLRWPIPLKLVKTLAQQELLTIERRAKYLLLNFSSGTLIMHLGMSGVCRVVSVKEDFIKHDHFVIDFKNGSSLRLNDPRRFGAVLWGGDKPFEHDLLKSLGPEPLTKAFNSAYLYALTRKKQLPIKTWLMTNRYVVGVGNIYANEALFLSGIHPLTPAAKLSNADAIKLSKEIKKILKKAIKAGGTTLKDFKNTEGKPGYFSYKLFVYGRGDQSCLICQTPIKTIRVAQRSTFYCAKCQILLR